MTLRHEHVSWERMIRAVEGVQERVTRTVQTPEAAGIPYAVVGGNAVAAWVARVDQAAVRNTQDVDILLRRSDMPAAIVAMEAAGFVHRHALGIEKSPDGARTKARDAVHVVFANDKVRKEYVAPAPDINDVDDTGDLRVHDLEPLVRMRLTSFRDKDRMQLRDLIDVELVDETRVPRFAPELACRLQQLLDDPDG